MLGFRIVWVGAILSVGAAGLHAQTALVDPKDARQIFSTTCSACHKSPQGLAKSGQVAGFLRQHYTTGPEMSAAMAAYLVAAGAAPAAKKGAETAAATKSKSKKQEQATEQAALSPADRAAEAKERSLRGKQRAAKSGEPKSSEEAARPAPSPLPPTPAPSEEIRQAAAPAAAAASPPAGDNPAPAASAPAQEPTPPPITLDLPLPPMPDAPPADLTQSAFSSSPVP